MGIPCTLPTALPGSLVAAQLAMFFVQVEASYEDAHSVPSASSQDACCAPKHLPFQECALAPNGILPEALFNERYMQSHTEEPDLGGRLHPSRGNYHRKTCAGIEREGGKYVLTVNCTCVCCGPAHVCGGNVGVWRTLCFAGDADMRLGALAAWSWGR